MTPYRTLHGALQRFLSLESAGGIVLVAAAVLATILMNSRWSDGYAAFLDLPFEIRLGAFSFGKPLLLWINDGLMAIFFFLVGLELKRELLEGELSSPGQVLLPLGAALAGMAAPAFVYWLVNAGDAVAMRGWAIPAATDIAFALGVLSLLGPRVPASLKVFLLALAIIDDLGAIVIIALFYSDDLSAWAFALAVLAMLGLLALNVRGVTRAAAYVVVGVALWCAVLKSGVHATLAGVLTAMFVPLRSRDDGASSPLRSLEESLHPWVAYGILPLFAFANAGLDFRGIDRGALFAAIPLGVGAGLFVGKQAGVLAAVVVMVKSGLARMPAGARWSQIYGVAVLCGIGFTMSLFIGSLAFENLPPSYAASVRLGVVSGSIASAVVGYLVLRFIASARGCHR